MKKDLLDVPGVCRWCKKEIKKPKFVSFCSKKCNRASKKEVFYPPNYARKPIW